LNVICLSLWSICVVQSNHRDVAQEGRGVGESFVNFWGGGLASGKIPMWGKVLANRGAVFGAVLQSFFLVKNLKGELVEIVYWRWDYFTRYGNYLDLVMHFMVFLSLLFFMTFYVYETESGPKNLCEPAAGIGALLYFIKSLWFLQGYRQTGPLIRMVLQIINDIKFLIVLLMLVLMGATVAFYSLTDGGRQIVDPDRNDPGENSMVSNIAMLFFYMYQSLLLGSFEYDDFNFLDYPMIAKFLFVLLTLFILVVLLNLLIALMSDSFERIKEREDQEYCYQRAKMIVDIEVLHMQGGGDKELRAQRFPKYVHVLKPDKGQDMQETEWYGVAGQIRKDLYRAQDAVNEFTKDQLTNPNTGLMAVMEKRMGDSIDSKLGLASKVTSDEMTKIQKEVKEVKGMMKEIMQKIKGLDFDGQRSSTAGSYKGGIAQSIVSSLN